jgi:hypothetical protein
MNSKQMAMNAAKVYWMDRIEYAPERYWIKTSAARILVGYFSSCEVKRLHVLKSLALLFEVSRFWVIWRHSEC